MPKGFSLQTIANLNAMYNKLTRNNPCCRGKQGVGEKANVKISRENKNRMGKPNNDTA